MPERKAPAIWRAPSCIVSHMLGRARCPSPRRSAHTTCTLSPPMALHTSFSGQPKHVPPGYCLASAPSVQVGFAMAEVFRPYSYSDLLTCGRSGPPSGAAIRDPCVIVGTCRTVTLATSATI